MIRNTNPNTDTTHGYDFFSFGCLNDRDCAYYDQATGMDVFNFQTCRRYPTGTLPDSKSASNNGCVCSNYVTTYQYTVKEAIDKNITNVLCTKVSSGTIAVFAFDSLMIFVQSMIAIRCFLILMHHVLLKLQQQKRKNKKTPLVKRHALFCIALLFSACICNISYLLSFIYSYVYGLPDPLSPYDQQLHFNELTFLPPFYLCYMFAAVCAFHFNIIWLSSTSKLFSKKVLENSGRFFNPLYYKRFIYSVEFIFGAGITLMSALRLDFVEFLLVPIGAIIIYQFNWGCNNIIRLLRLIASWDNNSSGADPESHSNSAKASTHKLNIIAANIHIFAKRCKRAGFLLILFYIIQIGLDLAGLGVSTSIWNNLRAIFNRFGDFCFTTMLVLFIIFLDQTVYGSRTAQEKTHVPSRIISKGPGAAFVKGDDDELGTKDLMEMDNHTNYQSSVHQDDLQYSSKQLTPARLDKVEE